MLARFLTDIEEFVEREHQIVEGKKLLTNFLFTRFNLNPVRDSIQFLDDSEKGCCLQIDTPLPSYLDNLRVFNTVNSTSKIIQIQPLNAETLKNKIEEPFKAYLQKLKETKNPIYLDYQTQSRLVFEEREKNQTLRKDVLVEDRKVITEGKDQTLFGKATVPGTMALTTSAPDTYPLSKVAT